MFFSAVPIDIPTLIFPFVEILHNLILIYFQQNNRVSHIKFPISEIRIALMYILLRNERKKINLFSSVCLYSKFNLIFFSKSIFCLLSIKPSKAFICVYLILRNFHIFCKPSEFRKIINKNKNWQKTYNYF